MCFCCIPVITKRAELSVSKVWVSGFDVNSLIPSAEMQWKHYITQWCEVEKKYRWEENEEKKVFLIRKSIEKGAFKKSNELTWGEIARRKKPVSITKII